MGTGRGALIIFPEIPLFLSPLHLKVIKRSALNQKVFKLKILTTWLLGVAVLQPDALFRYNSRLN